VPVPQLRGTRLARQGSITDLRVTFIATADGEYRAQTSSVPATDRSDTDNHWLQQGYVTVTPVSGDLSDATAPASSLKQRLRGL
jgi:broad specificity polyphosphatase/5'/3'-nucleotidase SurE